MYVHVYRHAYRYSSRDIRSSHLDKGIIKSLRICSFSWFLSDYIRLWVPELRRVPAPGIFEPWLMSPAELCSYGVTLGDSYPVPIRVKENSANASPRYGSASRSGESYRRKKWGKKISSVISAINCIHYHERWWRHYSICKFVRRLRNIKTRYS